jgi:carbonic anhydrase
MSPDDALAALLAGSRRFASGELQHPRRGSVRRAEVAQGQQPFAAIVSCSDSRVALEIIFDQGLGDLFVIRVAGNTVDAPVVLGSVEFAVGQLGCSLVMVLGHEQCGAVAAAVDVAEQGTALGGHLDAVVGPIVEVLDAARDDDRAARLEAAVRANVRRQVAVLARTSALADAVAAGDVAIVGAVYRLHEGEVELLDAPTAPR